jgi:hypothetical protein
MKTLLLGALALTLAGCTSSGKDDSGGGNYVLITDMNGDCSGGTCTWEVTTSGEMGTVELDLIETGDPTYECDSGKGELVCGVWSEYHNDFSLTDFGDDYETKSINLTLEDSYLDQVNNYSTIFDVSDATISAQLTVLFTVQDADGNYADCATYGDDPGYFADVCSNNANLW